jgi:hypothetical protein
VSTIRDNSVSSTQIAAGVVSSLLLQAPIAPGAVLDVCSWCVMLLTTIIVPMTTNLVKNQVPCYYIYPLMTIILLLQMLIFSFDVFHYRRRLQVVCHPFIIVG